MLLTTDDRRLDGLLCKQPKPDQPDAEPDRVEIEGGWPGIFPEAFVGYHAEVVDGVLVIQLLHSAYMTFIVAVLSLKYCESI